MEGGREDGNPIAVCRPLSQVINSMPGAMKNLSLSANKTVPCRQRNQMGSVFATSTEASVNRTLLSHINTRCGFMTARDYLESAIWKSAFRNCQSGSS